MYQANALFVHKFNFQYLDCFYDAVAVKSIIAKVSRLKKVQDNNT